MKIAEWLAIKMAIIASSLSMFGPIMIGIASQMLSFNSPVANIIFITSLVCNIILIVVIKKISHVSRGIQTLLALVSILIFIVNVWETYIYFHTEVTSAYRLNLYLTSFMLAVVSPAATAYCIYKESLYTYLTR